VEDLDDVKSPFEYECVSTVSVSPERWMRVEEVTFKVSYRELSAIPEHSSPFHRCIQVTHSSYAFKQPHVFQHFKEEPLLREASLLFW
jgi:hypothetical protein